MLRAAAALFAAPSDEKEPYASKYEARDKLRAQGEPLGAALVLSKVQARVLRPFLGGRRAAEDRPCSRKPHSLSAQGGDLPKPYVEALLGELETRRPASCVRGAGVACLTART